MPAMYVAVRTCRKNLRSENDDKPLKRLRCKTPPQRQNQKRHHDDDDDDVNRGCGGRSRSSADRRSSMPEKSANHGGG